MWRECLRIVDVGRRHALVIGRENIFCLFLFHFVRRESAMTTATRTERIELDKLYADIISIEVGTQHMQAQNEIKHSQHLNI